MLAIALTRMRKKRSLNGVDGYSLWNYRNFTTLYPNGESEPPHSLLIGCFSSISSLGPFADLLFYLTLFFPSQGALPSGSPVGLSRLFMLASPAPSRLKRANSSMAVFPWSDERTRVD